MEIKELIEEAYKNAKEHGFWDDIEVINMSNIDMLSHGYKSLNNNAISTRLMLIVGEVAEAQEGLRHNDIDNFKEELADVAIRLADLCGGLGIDLELEIAKKMDKNRNRPYKHGRLF